MGRHKTCELGLMWYRSLRAMEGTPFIWEKALFETLLIESNAERIIEVVSWIGTMVKCMYLALGLIGTQTMHSHDSDRPVAWRDEGIGVERTSQGSFKPVHLYLLGGLMAAAMLLLNQGQFLESKKREHHEWRYQGQQRRRQRQQWRSVAYASDMWFSEFPNSVRPLSTTWPWSIRPSLMVLWGVCWKFFDVETRQAEQGRFETMQMQVAQAIPSRAGARIHDASSRVPGQVFFDGPEAAGHEWWMDWLQAPQGSECESFPCV